MYSLLQKQEKRDGGVIQLLVVIVASAVNVLAALIYNRDIFKGSNRPSPVTWFLSALITILNFKSFRITCNDEILTILPKTMSAITIVIFIFLAFSYIKLKRKIRIDTIDILIMLAVVVIITTWKVLKLDTYANLIVQLCSAAAIVPTIRKLQNEDPLPWFIWSGGYCLGSIALFLNWQGRYLALIYPVGATISHLAIGFFSLYKRKARKIK